MPDATSGEAPSEREAASEAASEGNGKPQGKPGGRTVVVRFAMREVEAEVRGTKAPAVAAAVRQRMQAGDLAEFEVAGGGLQGPWRAVKVRLPVLEAAAIEEALQAAAASALGKQTDASTGLTQPSAVRTARGPDGGPGFEFPRSAPTPLAPDA